MKKNQGITLIALVITIIVIFILLAVTVYAAFSENGLIARAREAANRWKEEQEREIAYLNELDIDNLAGGNTGGENTGENGGGSEEDDDIPEIPVEYIPIYTEEQLAKVASGAKININEIDYIFKNDANYILMNDVDVGGTLWVPIPNFKGTFDGKNKEVINLGGFDAAESIHKRPFYF